MDSLSEQQVDFASGLIAGGVIAGTLEGIGEGVQEFVPSLLSSMSGLGNGLWAFALSPLQVSQQLIESCQACIASIKDTSPPEIIQQLVPELKKMIVDWETLTEFRKGELTGKIIGRYGVDLFAGAGLVKCMKEYRDLKRANALLTLEACAISEPNAAKILQESQKRWELREQVCKNGTLKIEWDKQGKHIEGHRNYQEDRKRSILTHPNPQQLVDDYAGTGIRRGNEIPGICGYQEIIDFEEVTRISRKPKRNKSSA